MKNWIKIIKIENAKTLVQRSYDDEESETAPYLLEIVFNINGALNKVGWRYKNEKLQEKAFNNITKDMVQDLYDGIMQFHS